jgi:hypothetical protein
MRQRPDRVAINGRGGENAGTRGEQVENQKETPPDEAA